MTDEPEVMLGHPVRIRVGAIALYRLARSWDTTARALRAHIMRHHGRNSNQPIRIKSGKIRSDNLPALEASYLPTRGAICQNESNSAQ